MESWAGEGAGSGERGHHKSEGLMFLDFVCKVKERPGMFLCMWAVVPVIQGP